MSTILISTSWRHTDYNQPSGRLLAFDLQSRKIIRSCEILEPPYREYDPNPRGGFRGLKGISIDSERIAIANASTVFLYDLNWKPLGTIWHPSCAGIHDIYLQDERVWVTSSRNDLVICFDLRGKLVKYYDIRTFPIINKFSHNQIKPFLTENQITLGEINFRDPRTHDHAITDILHINSFIILDNGDYLVSYGLLRVIDSRFLHQLNNRLKQTSFSDLLSKTYRLYREIFKKNKTARFEDRAISKQESASLILKISQKTPPEMCLILNDCTVPSHSLRLLKDKSAIYLNSTSGELVNFDPQQKQVFSKTKVGEKFLRGARQLEDQSVVLGDNNHLVHYDPIEKRVISSILISDDPAEAIFDVHVLPDHVPLPPESFPAQHEKYLPVDQISRDA